MGACKRIDVNRKKLGEDEGVIGITFPGSTTRVKLRALRDFCNLTSIAIPECVTSNGRNELMLAIKLTIRDSKHRTLWKEPWHELDVDSIKAQWMDR